MNWFTLNSQPINTKKLLWDYLLDNISFNNYWLQNSNIITEWNGFWLRDYPNRRINLIDIPQGDWQILNDTFFWWRNINVSWILRSENKQKLDDLIDEFKLNLSFPNKLLKHRVNGVIRQINATCNNITFWTKENIYIPFEINFISQDSFWVLNNQESYLLENISDNTRTEDITNNLKEVYPLIIVWIKSWSITAFSVKSNDIWININQTFNNWDIIYIDWRKKEVLINWIDTDYTGVFPLLKNGSNNVVFNITWTYTADISIIWENAYL